VSEAPNYRKLPEVRLGAGKTSPHAARVRAKAFYRPFGPGHGFGEENKASRFNEPPRWLKVKQETSLTEFGYGTDFAFGGVRRISPLAKNWPNVDFVRDRENGWIV
jgi:hypothetical protein